MCTLYFASGKCACNAFFPPTSLICLECFSGGGASYAFPEKINTRVCTLKYVSENRYVICVRVFLLSYSELNSLVYVPEKVLFLH